MPVPPKDREILRRLGSEVAEIAALPVQEETKALWRALNGLRPVRPMVMIDQVCWHEMNVDDELTLQCENGFCRSLEGRLRRTLYQWRHMRVDMVVEPFIDIPKAVRNSGVGIQVQEERKVLDPANSVVSHFYLDQIETEADLEKIRPQDIRHDEAATAEAEEKGHEIFDGVLQVRMQGQFPTYAPWDRIVQWRGHESTLFDMVDRPEFMHQIVQRLTDSQLRMLDQLESQGLLGFGQGTIHCTGAYTDELPPPDADPDHPRAKDLWTFGMSQIFAAVSPDMHEEFELPYLGPWFERFGLCYYGCCEPLDQKIDMVRRLPHVRKVSMSPWVDEERGAAAINGDFVYSRKPNPAQLAVDDWDVDAVERHLRHTLDVTARHGCAVELILKDISTVRYQPQRLWQWAEVAMRLVNEA